MRNAWQKRVAGSIACNVALLFAPVAVSNAQEDKPARQTAAILGRLVPVRTVAVVARVSGVLRELHVQEGDRVEQGQVIAQLDAHRAEFAVALALGVLIDTFIVRPLLVPAMIFLLLKEKDEVPGDRHGPRGVIEQGVSIHEG